MKYIALDFETANSSPCSACSVGISIFEDHKFLSSQSQLLCPPAEFNHFNWYNIKVHGIHPHMVTSAPRWDEIWPAIQPEMENSVLVCHNAMFDTSVLCKTLAYYGLELPRCQYVCTVKIAKRVWPQLTNHKLDTVSSALSINLNHHEAGSDAFACGKILQAALDQMHCADVNALAQKIGMRLGKISPEGCVSCSIARNKVSEPRYL